MGSDPMAGDAAESDTKFDEIPVIIDADAAEMDAKPGAKKSDSECGDAKVPDSDVHTPKAEVEAMPKKSFFQLFRDIHDLIQELPGFSRFVAKFSIYTGPLILSQVFLLVVFAIFKEDGLTLVLHLAANYGQWDALPDAMTQGIDLEGPNAYFEDQASLEEDWSAEARPVPARYRLFAGLVGSLFAALKISCFLLPAKRDTLIEDFKGTLMAEQMGRLVGKVLSLPYDAMISTPGGQFMQIMTKVWTNDAMLGAIYGQVFPVVFECALITIILFVLHPLLFWLPTATLVLITKLALWKADRDEASQKKMREVFMRNMGRLMGLGDCYERAHFFDNCEHERRQTVNLFSEIGAVMGAMKKQTVWDGIWLPLLNLLLSGLAGSIAAVVLWWEWTNNRAGWPGLFRGDGDHGNASADRVLEMFMVWLTVFRYGFSLVLFSNTVGVVKKAVYDHGEVQTFFDVRSDVADVQSADELIIGASPSIEFRNVSFSYGGKDILKNVSFKLEGGQRLGLAGTSGCGKTTILKLLLRFYPLHDAKKNGTIFVDGHDISKVTRASLLRAFSVVAQQADIFSATVLENIRYGRLNASEDEVMEAGRRAGLMLNRKPVESSAEGLDAAQAAAFAAAAPVAEEDGELSIFHPCGEKGAKLSGGQRQRVQLARALLKQGSIYLLDEPTTGLDGVVSRKLQETMDELSKHATTVCITHHLEDLKNADHILYLEKGVVKEQGTFQQLMEQKGDFAGQVAARQR